MRKITPAFLRRRPLPLHDDADKDDRGRVFVVGGMQYMPGPALLAAVGALRAGAGKLQVGVPASVAMAIAVAIPEALVVPLGDRDGALTRDAADAIVERAQRVDALVFGPGLSSDDTDLMHDVVRQVTTPMVVDAGALAAASSGPFDGRAILTPHTGELAGLFGVDRGEIDAKPETFALESARRFGAVVALKGPKTYIADPDGRCAVNEAGAVGLATSGSGDALAGIIGGILARGVEPFFAAAWGVYLHARAGRELTRRMGVGFLAREVLSEIPPLMRRLSKKSSRG